MRYLLACLLALPVMQAAAQQAAPQAVPQAMPEAAPAPAKFTPFAEETVTTDDDVFRISNQVDPLTAIGSPSRGDTYRTTSVGVSADVPVSLQRFDATLTYNSFRYDRFHQLDYDGYDLRGSWLWQVGRNLSGEVGVTDSYSLASFAEVLGVVPDKLHLREEFAKGSWLVTPDWKLYGAADQLVQSNSDPAGQFNDVTVTSAEASLSRLVGTANWIGLDTRFESGHFPVAEPAGTALIDNAYSQYGFGLVVDWGADTPSHVVARAGQVDRRYDQLSQRNFDETTAHLEYTWTPDPKVAVTAIAERDISPYEYIHSSIVLVKGIVLRPVWHATPKLDLSADFEALSRSYLADPLITLGLEIPRVDQVHTLSALLSYRPIEHLSLELSALHEERSSNIEFGGYVVDGYWLKVRLAL